jgi:hypothetical protein
MNWGFQMALMAASGIYLIGLAALAGSEPLALNENP